MKTTLRCLASLIPLLLAACAHQAPTPPADDDQQQPQASAPSKGASQLADAATAPLGDLNLVRAKIPQALQDAHKAPYAMPEPLNCVALVTEVQALDEALGPDLDTPPSDKNPGLIERGGNAAGKAAVGALRDAAEGLVPFRGWVRKLTGAERHSRQVAASIASGTVRRSFLKGLGQSLNCVPPAAPLR